MTKPLRIALVAGETSGDMLGGTLIAALKTHLPNAEFFGIGGPKMQEQGCHLSWRMENLSVMGHWDALKQYRRIASIRNQFQKALLRTPPDLFIGIDAPDFNLGLEIALKKKGILTMHYVSPSIWAWRSRRIKKIAKAVDRILVLFPMEVPLYEAAKVPVSFVGHPLADQIPLETDRYVVRKQIDLPIDLPLIALLPGSRIGELERMADLFVETAKILQQDYLPNAGFIVPLVSRETKLIFEEAIYRHNASSLSFRLLFGHADFALGAADVSLVASGTATLEAAFYKKPFVITYKVPPFSYWLAKHLVHSPWVGLPNILCKKSVVPEILQEDATPASLAKALHAEYQQMATAKALEDVFTELHLSLRQNNGEKAAQAVLDCLGVR